MASPSGTLLLPLLRFCLFWGYIKPSVFRVAKSALSGALRKDGIHTSPSTTAQPKALTTGNGIMGSKGHVRKGPRKHFPRASQYE